MSLPLKMCCLGGGVVAIALVADLVIAPTPALSDPEPDTSTTEQPEQPKNAFGVKPYEPGKPESFFLLPQKPPARPKTTSQPEPKEEKTPISISTPTNIQTSNAYINRVAPIAQRLYEQRGIPVSMTIAVAIHETGNGKAVIGKDNHWGIKCLGSGSQCTKTKTQEYVGGQANSYNLAFETCEDIDRCTRILANTFDNLLVKGGGDKSLYKTNPDAAFRAIHRGGYATDPNWSNAVIRHRHNVERIIGKP